MGKTFRHFYFKMDQCKKEPSCEHHFLRMTQFFRFVGKVIIESKPKLPIHLFLKDSLEFSKDSPHKIELDSINRDERNITHSVLN